MSTMHPWVKLDAATKLIQSLDDRTTRQFADAALFELETGIAKDSLQPDGLFDCLFFARVAVRLFSDHNALRTASRERGCRLEQVEWPARWCSQVAEAIQFCESIRPPNYRLQVVILAVKALTEEMSLGTLPESPVDLLLFAKLISGAISSDLFFFGVLDGVDFEIPMTE